MKNYTKEKKIAEMLQQYKKLKVLEKKFNDDEKIIKDMKSFKPEEGDEEAPINLDGFSEEQLAAIIDLYQRCKSKAAAEKKEYTLNVKQMERDIGKEILELFEKENAEKENKVIEKSVAFPNLGTVKCSKETVRETNFKEDEIGEIINNLIEEGYDNLLTIAPDKYIEFSKQLYDSTGNELPGVIKKEEIKPKITLSRK